MAKKQEQVDKIVENEPVVINEKDIISEEVKENDVIDVDAPEVIIEAKAEEEAKAEAEEKAKAEEEAKAKAEAEKKKTDAVKLRVLIGFTDKYTKQDYAVNDEIYVDKDRAKELLANEKRLVKNLKIGGKYVRRSKKTHWNYWRVSR